MQAFTFIYIFTLIAMAVSSVIVTFGSSPASIIARQDPDPIGLDIPSECQAICDATDFTTTCGTDVACVCDPKWAQNLVGCADCAIKHLQKNPGSERNITDIQYSGQDLVDSISDSCEHYGYPIGRFAVMYAGSSNGAISTRMMAMTSASALGLAVVMAVIL